MNTVTQLKTVRKNTQSKVEAELSRTGGLLRLAPAGARRSKPPVRESSASTLDWVFFRTVLSCVTVFIEIVSKDAFLLVDGIPVQDR